MHRAARGCRCLDATGLRAVGPQQLKRPVLQPLYVRHACRGRRRRRRRCLGGGGPLPKLLLDVLQPGLQLLEPVARAHLRAPARAHDDEQEAAQEEGRPSKGAAAREPCHLPRGGSNGSSNCIGAAQVPAAPPRVREDVRRGAALEGRLWRTVLAEAGRVVECAGRHATGRVVEGAGRQYATALRHGHRMSETHLGPRRCGRRLHGCTNASLSKKGPPTCHAL
mmetsp:Transcript_55132/g.178645  ORF Transcript_55132/g.178645 Transcript_55132/m.178645 type:complete len:223 (+) Transcript_55132:1164-1832(+)